MAFGSVYTMLALNRYARILGINPAHFAGANQVDRIDSGQVFPLNNAQNNIWPQYAWQNDDMVSRDDLAQAIEQSEMEISSFIGYFPTRNWVENEQVTIKKNFRPEINSWLSGIVTPNMAKFISGGKRAVTLVRADAPVVYLDKDSDGIDETAQITFANPGYGIEQVKIYYPGKNGERVYEIRNPYSKVISGNNIVVTFKTWDMLTLEILEYLPSNNESAADITNPDHILQTVDIYREYNDVTQPHVAIYTVDNSSGAETKYDGFITRDVNYPDSVILHSGSYVNGAWSESAIDAGCSVISRVEINYYSGESIRQYIPNVDDYIRDEIARAIAFMATSRLDRPYNTNGNATALAESLMKDMVVNSRDTFTYITDDVAHCPFGTKYGEYRSWKLISKFVARKWKSATI